MPTNDSDLGVRATRRHEEYYFRDGTVFFIVENVTFRLHRFLFERESEFFRVRLEGEDGSPDSPYKIDDIKSEEFAEFLWVWYKPKYTFSKQPKSKWLTILRLATKWNFGEIRELAIRRLEKFELEPIEKITTYKEYAVDKKLLLPSYASLCRRVKRLSLEEADILGMEAVLKIGEAREQAILSASERGCRTPTTASLPDDVVHAAVAEIFGLTLHSNDPPVQLEGQTGNTSGNVPVVKEVITVKPPNVNNKGKMNGGTFKESPQSSPAPVNGAGGKGKYGK